MVPSSSAEEQRGKELVSVLTIKNTFDFPLEIFPHEEDDLVEVEAFEIPAGGPSLQLECPVVGQLFKVLNQETKEVVAHISGGSADQFLLIGPQTFLEIKNSIRAATVEEVTLHVYYQPPDRDEEYLYDPDVLERGDSMEIECLLGSTWLVRNAVTHDLLMRYTVNRQSEDTNLVVLSNSSTVLDDPANAMATKIHFINELGFPVLIYKQDPSSPGEEQLLTQLQNHGQLQTDAFVGEEFLVRKEEDNTLGAVVLGALDEQTCPLGDETQISFLNTGAERADVFFYNEVSDQELLMESIEPNEQKTLDAFRSHQWIVKSPDGVVILTHTT